MFLMFRFSALVMLVGIVIAMASPLESCAAVKRPNFVFILTDDQSPETLACYGTTACETPHLDRLAAEGMVIDDAHHMGSWVGAVCTASRTMIMTGRSVWQIPGRKNVPGVNASPAYRKQCAEQSLPAIFNRAGYDTFRTCKRGNSFDDANVLFTHSHIATKREGTTASGSAWHADRVLDYLRHREQTNPEKPFLIYFGFSHPHDPRDAPPELLEKYGVGPMFDPAKAPPLQPNYLPKHPFHHGHPGLRDEEHVAGVKTARDEVTIRRELGREFACIENIDRQVGRVIEQLRTMGELENTYIIFTSDHGIAVGRHGLLGKQNLYEHTWRVPMIVKGPRIASGSRASGYVYLMDVLPTLCDLAEIEPPAGIDGRSFRDVLEGRRQTIRDSLYGVYCGGTLPGMRSIKKDGWKLVTYHVLDGAVQQTQLFDLKNNPREFLFEHHDEALQTQLKIEPNATQVNLADEPEYAAKRGELERLLYEQAKRLGDPYIDQFSLANSLDATP